MATRTITISFDDIEELYGTEHTLLVRLYRHAKERALQGLEPCDRFHKSDLDFEASIADWKTLDIFGFVEINDEIVYLPKYTRHNPTTNQLKRSNELTRKRMQNYRERNRK